MIASKLLIWGLSFLITTTFILLAVFFKNFEIKKVFKAMLVIGCLSGAMSSIVVYWVFL